MTETHATKGAKTAKAVLRYVGLILGCAAVGFVLYEVSRADWSILVQLDPMRTSIVAAVAVLVYTCISGVLAFNWTLLTRASGATSLQFSRGIRIYSITQIYKYLPSNVVHFVGRHLMARREGTPDSALLAAALLESVLLVVSASLFAGIAGRELLASVLLATGMQPPAPVLIVSLGAAVLFAVAASIYFANRAVSAAAIQRGKLRNSISISALLYLIFFAGCGAIGWLIVTLALGTNISYFAVTGALSLAWVIGYVSFGAPAGVGIREVVLISILGTSLSATECLTLAILYRLVTVLGDLTLATIFQIVRLLEK